MVFPQAHITIAGYGAGGRDRTDITSLEGWGFTIKLHPHALTVQPLTTPEGEWWRG